VIVVGGAEAAGAPDLESRFTVIINTFKRPDLLKTSIAHYEACAGVDQIRVVRTGLSTYTDLACRLSQHEMERTPPHTRSAG
jgi:hypothetical protein